MNQDFINNVTAALEALVQAGTLQGWTLKATASRSHQRLYSSPNGKTLSCHQSRRVNGEAFQLSVFSPSDKEGMVGNAMMDLVTFLPIDEQLTEAIELSRGSLNPQWKLAGPPKTPPAPVETCDPEIRDRPEGVIESIEREYAEAFAATTGCRLNSAELFVNYSISTLTNSAGLSYDVEGSNIYLETAMEKAGTENDKEVHEHDTAIAARDLDVKDFINRCALQVSVLGDSKEPETADGATILVDKEALSQMLDSLVQQLSCINEYLRLPFLKLGDRFGNADGDALHLSLDPTLPCMALSCVYALDGIPAKGGVLIDNNAVTDRIIPNRFGQYLELTPNGRSGNLVVKPGTLTPELLKGMEYIEVIKFSSLLIDSRKLTWSSEIKLGRHIAADGTATLIKGGVVSGNLKENFSDCRFSSTLGSVSVPSNSYAPALGYRGPDAMLITRGVSIAGSTKGE